MRLGIIPEDIRERVALFANMAPIPVAETFMGIAMARTISSAIRLGVIDALEDRPLVPSELAETLDLDVDGTESLLMALWSLGYVERKGDRFELTEMSSRFLLKNSPDSVATYAGHLNIDMWEWLEQTEDVLRTNKPVEIHSADADDPFWERYMRALFEVARFGADEVALRMRLSSSDTRMVDLAGGHGGYSCALVKRYPKLSSTVVDLEGATRIGRKLVDEAGFSDRIDYRVGDILNDDIGSDYDLACLFHILHHFTSEESLTVLERARESLSKGGKVAVLEQVLPADGERPTQLGALTGLLFFVTSGARTYSIDEIKGWLDEAGFEHVRSRNLSRFPGMALITGQA